MFKSKSLYNTVKKYLITHPECEHYVITDPDIELDNVNDDSGGGL